MTLNTNTDWREVASLNEELQAAWLSEHGMNQQDEGTRREWQREFISGSLELEEDERTGLARGMLNSLLRMQDEEAMAFVNDFQWVMDHGKGEDAFAMISALHTGARGMAVDDTTRLGQIWPRVFGKDISAAV